MSATNAMDESPVLKYLGLPPSYEPSPRAAPVEFLRKHVRELPPHLLTLFSSATSPKERTTVPAIRNRRLKFAESNPAELSLANAKSTWPALWEGRERPGQEQGKEEKDWAEKEFLGGEGNQQVGKLGKLLGEYEEERESERVRTVRRQRAEYIESLPEEDEDTDDEDDELPIPQELSIAETEEYFLRSVKERFIYGFLESIDYDRIDWDERWDSDLDRDDEERWFDDEEESSADPPPDIQASEE
ncbi:hypothetical protein L226DRAFT_452064 [Lentinus tigrinus ALCF2SS1-7]|uniref:CCD97-like C-terminal domain-containing protein n=1 Tax=Lentinus tigrinus ALCF2SS1-6 TaxID=1328759 RepID=A0A5C2SVQ9_9APHY|nr:hypothetical protein L227DRAFT_491362 [Lentinus tigrinus ALCF2SS1-6]RPD81281.1 hypothetical protein L226DRAFT_452064 [Lentinus tigrinus ALCF2SS1-7]